MMEKCSFGMMEDWKNGKVLKNFMLQYSNIPIVFRKDAVNQSRKQLLLAMSKKCKKDNDNEKEEKKSDATYVCKKCGSSSHKEKKLCKPIKNK